MSLRRAPLLVTGVPRSGTTWLARWLALAPGTAMTGREPMNPRRPRRPQYALAHTLDGWTRLTQPTPKQRRALAMSYRGLTPHVYSRYGVRQWAAALPWTRLVIKDPFAMLSIPTISSRTGAVPVLVYRHPGAVLASYRRMGWSPHYEEVQQIVEECRRTGGPQLPDLPSAGEAGPAVVLGRYWATLHDLFLADTQEGTGVTVVSHRELALNGPRAGKTLVAALGLEFTEEMERRLAGEFSAARPKATGSLHNFDRAPAAVAEAWREMLAPDEVEAIERVTADTRARLQATRLVLSGPAD